MQNAIDCWLYDSEAASAVTWITRIEVLFQAKETSVTREHISPLSLWNTSEPNLGHKSCLLRWLVQSS